MDKLRVQQLFNTLKGTSERAQVANPVLLDAFEQSLGDEGRREEVYAALQNIRKAKGRPGMSYADFERGLEIETSAPLQTDTPYREATGAVERALNRLSTPAPGVQLPEGVRAGRQDLRPDTGWFVGDLAERAGAGFLRAGAGIAGALDKLGVGDKAEARLNLPGGETNNTRLLGELSRDLRKWEEALMRSSDRYGGKGVLDLWNEGKKGEAVGEVILKVILKAPESLAFTGAGLVGGPVGMSMVGLGIANDKYEQLTREHPNMPEMARVLNAVATGAA
jgi:hypothetical protein